MTSKRIERIGRTAALAITALALAVWGLGPVGPAGPRLAAGQCPVGYDRVATGTAFGCLNQHHPESYRDFSTAMSLGAAHDASTSAGLRYGAHTAAVEQSQRLAAKATGGTWRPS